MRHHSVAFKSFWCLVPNLTGRRPRVSLSTMSSLVSIPSEITVSKIEFGPVKLLDNGGKTVNVRYEGRNIMTETPSLPVPYGVNVYDKTPGAPPKYSVDLSLRGADDNETVKEFQDFLEGFDERMIDAGVENASKWFKMNNPNREVIKAFYTPLLKYSRDPAGNLKPYPPTVKLSLRKNKGAPATGTNIGSFQSKFYDPSAELDDKGEIPEFAPGTDINQILSKRSQVTAIMQCTGVWFAGGKFGTTWTTTQFRVDSQPAQIRGPAFRSEAPDIRAFVAKNLAAASSSSASASHPYEAEAEEEDEDAEEETVVAAVLPPKKAAVASSSSAAPALAPKHTAFVEEAVAEPVPVPKKVVKKVVTKVAGK